MEYLQKEIAEIRDFIARAITIFDATLPTELYTEDKIANNLEIGITGQDGRNMTTLKFKADYEYELFDKLFQYEPQRLYHYTSFESLFYILKGGKLHLNALTGMNDRSEVGYINTFMGREPNPSTMTYHNYHFAFCLSEEYDQLNQWRLYGDDAKGVIIEFSLTPEISKWKNILVSKMHYHLDFFSVLKEYRKLLSERYSVLFGLYEINLWKFFFKNKDYFEEKEIRLMIKNVGENQQKKFPIDFKLNRYGLIVPFIELDLFMNEPLLKIEGVTLGPNMKEPDTNQAQIEYMIGEKYPSAGIVVKQSQIKHYR